MLARLALAQPRSGDSSAPTGAGSPRPAPASAPVTPLGIVPFVGEGGFPLDTTLGLGLGRRRALDLSSLTPATLVNPLERFFIRTGCPDGLPPAALWSVRIHGLVETPLEIPLAEIERDAVPLGPQLLECAGNSRAAHFGLMSVATWTGVPLERLLGRVKRRPRATRVLVSGFDKHTTLDPGSVAGASWIFALDELRAAEAFLATGMNGAPLSPDHGHPLRLVVPGWYGCTAIKWVNEVALVDDHALATGQMHEYAGRTHQAPAGARDRLLIESGQRPEGPRLAKDFHPASIDPAALPVRVEKLRANGGPIVYRIVGIAWGGRSPGSGLAIRLLPGRAPAPVEEIVGAASSPWALWSHTAGPLPPGRYRIELSTTDPAARARRLEAGHYTREIEVTGD